MSRIDVPGPSRSPWQRVYGLAHRMRRGWWSRRAERLPRPVLSIGNLHWGGGGKTPLTAAVARHLHGRGLRVAILSRGYGRQGEGVTVVSHGDGPLLGPRQAGDEPVLLAADAPGVAVVVAADRALAGHHAMHRLDPVPDVFLLDDGFSHLRLHRDLDLLVFPAADPLAGGRLWPGGRLREPLASAARADALLVTGIGLHDEDGNEDGAAAEMVQTLVNGLRRHGFEGPGFVASTKILDPRPVGQSSVPSSGVDSVVEPAAGPMLLVCAIARPDGFRRTVAEAGLDVAGEVFFRDHDPYDHKALDKIRRAFDASGARAVVVTSKDRVKLQSRLDRPLVEIPVRAEPAQAFFDWLDTRVDELVSARSGEAAS